MNIEEAANHYARVTDPEAHGIDFICEVFIAGAEWQKDALLEWAKDNLLECEVSNDETDYGRIDVYKKLIDKLNSL